MKNSFYLCCVVTVARTIRVTKDNVLTKNTLLRNPEVAQPFRVFLWYYPEEHKQYSSLEWMFVKTPPLTVVAV